MIKVTKRLVLAFSMLQLSIGMLHAQTDVVYTKVGKDNLGRFKVTGMIQDYTGKNLIIRTKGGTVKTIALDRIHAVETTRLPEHLQGNELLQKNQFSKATQKYRVALSQEKREWMKREITASLVWALRGTKNIPAAGNLSLKIIAGDSTTPYFSCLPFAWNFDMADLAQPRETVKWMNSDSQPAAQLLGASYLLSGTHRKDAIATLKQLSIHHDLRIAILAQTQLWRTEPTADLKTLDRWQQIIHKLPERLRSGPNYILGQFLEKQNQHQRAALVLMKPVILNHSDRWLAGYSLAAAANSLDNAGEKQIAKRMYQEVIKKYSDLPVAQEVKQRLKQ